MPMDRFLAVSGAPVSSAWIFYMDSKRHRLLEMEVF